MESERKEEEQQDEESTPALSTPSRSWVEVVGDLFGSFEEPTPPTAERIERVELAGDTLQSTGIETPIESTVRQFTFEDLEVVGRPDDPNSNLNSESRESSSPSLSSSSNSASSESTVTMASANEVNVGGMKIKLSATAQAAQVEATPMFKKTERKALSEDKRNDLFDKATKNVLTKFDLMTLSIKDEDKLDDTYNMHILISKMKAHMIKYDMHDVFTIVNVKADGMNVESEVKNLFTNYSSITEEEVANSNKWYSTWPEEETFRQDLQLTLQFLENNITERLWDKCIEVYDNYKPEEKGGPLLFIIMMKKLQVDTDAAVEYLQTRVKTMKITNFDGEDVSRVVSLIRGVWKRLKGVGSSKVPSDFPKQILTIF